MSGFEPQTSHLVVQHATSRPPLNLYILPYLCQSVTLFYDLYRDVNKDLTPKDKDKDLTPKDKDKDLTPKDQDKDKDLKYCLKDKDEDKDHS